MPRISVIVPVHNTEEYLPTCLNSIVSQTEESIEVIAINDCSTDNSLKVMKHFEKKYPYKMKIVDLKENVGVSTARNIGLDLAQGDYIGFVDSDDIISLNMYENFYNLARQYNVNIVVGNHFRVPSNKYLNQETYLTEERRKPEIVNYHEKTKPIFFETPAVWDKLFKHESIENVRFLDGRIYEDVGFTYPMLLRENKVVEYLNADYGYRITRGSIMNSGSIINPNILDIIEVATYAYQLGKEWQLDEEALRELRDILKGCICKISQNINKWEVSKKHKKALIEQMLSLANVTFPKIFEMETEKGQSHNEFILECLKEKYCITSIPECQLDFQKENLKRKIKTIGQKQKTNR